MRIKINFEEIEDYKNSKKPIEIIKNKLLKYNIPIDVTSNKLKVTHGRIEINKINLFQQYEVIYVDK